MDEVSAHYRTLLGPIYSWMVGGAAEAIDTGAADLRALGITPTDGALALDLGAGFGVHAIPLARLGYRVIAIDSCQPLLDELQRLSEGLAIQAVQSDLRQFAACLTAPPQLVLCLGDTLTHLASLADVQRLCSAIAAGLTPGGRFIASFRDYTSLGIDETRCILVRSDERRIHTCVLASKSDQQIHVHDLVHERAADDTWQLRCGGYPKLRLAPAYVVQLLADAGLAATLAPGSRGLVTISALKSR